MLRLASAIALLLIFFISYLLERSGFLSISAFSASTLPTSTSHTAFIPFAPSSLTPNNLPWTNPVRMPWCLDHQSYCYTGILDTSYTGVILSAADLTDYNRSSASLFPIGWHFLSSSKILYVGNWIPRNLTFPTDSPIDNSDLTTGSKIYGTDTSITAEVPILAVTKKVVCPGYDVKKDGPECPASMNGTEIDMPAHIVYFGVGFGRQYNVQLQGNPDKNPFLNIIAINGAPISSSEMHGGYVITNQGVHVGLTDENARGFEKVELSRQTGYSDDVRDWAQTRSCITVAKRGSDLPPCVNATMLVDTGIAQMYLTLPPSIPVAKVREKSASSRWNVSVLANNQTVSVRFGSQPSAGYSDDDREYSVVVGDVADEVVPTQVITTVSNTTAPFVNTGRYFLRRYDILFDARDGWYGVRRKKEEEEYKIGDEGI